MNKRLCMESREALRKLGCYENYSKPCLTEHVARLGFTLAEVLITLGIIGVVAAITMPLLIKSYQKMVLKNQFKKTYSIMYNAFKKAEADLGYTPQCYYWDKNPYGPWNYHCVQENENGDCIKYADEHDKPLPADYNGRFGDCTVLKNELVKNLNIIKECNGNAYPSCIPEYEGNDTLIKSENENLSDSEIIAVTSGCKGWRKNDLLSKNFVYVLADGQILISYSTTFNPSIFAVDINGKKGPNKWGHDIFEFRPVGVIGSPLKLAGGGCMPVDKGGSYAKDMIINMSK